MHLEELRRSKRMLLSGQGQNLHIRSVRFGLVDGSAAGSLLSKGLKLFSQVAFSTPLLASPLLSFAMSAFSLDRDNSAFASHREQAQGGRAKLSVCRVLRISAGTTKLMTR